MAKSTPVSDAKIELMLEYVENFDRYPEEFSQDEMSITDEEAFFLEWENVAGEIELMETADQESRLTDYQRGIWHEIKEGLRQRQDILEHYDLPKPNILLQNTGEDRER